MDVVTERFASVQRALPNRRGFGHISTVNPGITAVNGIAHRDSIRDITAMILPTR